MRVLLTALVLCLFQASIVVAQLQWRPLYEPGVGGAVTAASICPHASNVVLAGGDILGIARSLDGGATWDQNMIGLQNYMIEEFTWHPTDLNTVWVGTGNGPYRSTDGGKNWISMRNGMPSNGDFATFTAFTQVVLFDPTNDNRLLAFFGTRRRSSESSLRNQGLVYESLNGGANWTMLAQPANTTGNIASATFLAGSTSQTILASVLNKGIYRSKDGGGTWQLSSTGLPSMFIESIAAHSTDPNIAYVTVGGSGVYTTSDGGDSWVPFNNGLPLSGTWRHVAVSPSNPSTLYAMNKDNQRLFRSVNGGNWTEIYRPANAFDFTFEAGQVTIDPGNDSRVLISTWVTIFRSEDGCKTIIDSSSYRPFNQSSNFWRGRGYSGYVAINFKWNPVNTDRSFTLAMDDGLWISNDNFKTWKSAAKSGLPPFGGYTDMTFTTDGTTAYATRGQPGWTYGNSVAKSIDGGLTWSEAGYPSDLDKYNAWMYPQGILVHPTDANKVWTTASGRLYTTSNGGSSWQRIPLNDTVDANTGSGLLWFVSRGSNIPTEFFLSGRRGIYYTSNGVDFSLMTNSPKNWQYGDTRLEMDPTTPDRLYAIARGYFQGQDGVWRATYNGASSSWTWKRIVGWGGSPNIEYVSDIAINPANPNQAVIGTRKDPFDDVIDATGAWTTQNLLSDAPTWTLAADGLGMKTINTLRAKPGNEGIIVAGTGGGGYYIAKFDGTPVDTGANVPRPSDACNCGNLLAVPAITDPGSAQEPSSPLTSPSSSMNNGVASATSVLSLSVFVLGGAIFMHF